MSEGVMSVNAGASVLEAARLLVNAGVSAMPVIDNQGVMIGILSEADLIKHTGGMAPTELSDVTEAAKALDEARARRVAEVMTRDVVTATEDTTLRDVADLLLKHRIKRVPIVRGGLVVGIVSRVDLLRALISLGLDAYTHAPEGVRTVDDQLRSAVVTVLAEHNWSQVPRADVVISHGVVHLWGVVTNDAMRSTFVEAVRSVPGVKSVENHMHVGRPLRAGWR
jgi:CBS domain-containing protein